VSLLITLTLSIFTTAITSTTTNNSNIQVENPVAVLDQEEAKKFLTGKAQDKYSFFLKATELERINRVYASTLDSVEEMADLSHKVKQNVVTLQEKSKSLKKQYEQHQQLTKLEHKVLELNVHYAWSVWNEKDTKRQQAQDKMDQFKTKAAKKQEELTQAEQEEEANAGGGGDQQGDERTRRIRELTAEVGEQEDRKRELEAQLAALNGPYKGQQRDYKRLTRTLEQATAQVQAAQQRLHQARQERLAAAGSAASEEKRRNEELQESEAQLAVRKQQAQPLKQAVSNALRVYEELEPQVHESKVAVQKVQRQLHAASSTLQELENSSNSSDNSMAVFGQRTSKVHSMVCCLVFVLHTLLVVLTELLGC
jgi:structural maintenance of chromosomes protein 6